MEFPDGRIKEGIFENNRFKNPEIDPSQLKNLKAQEVLLHQTISSVVDKKSI